MALFSPGTDFEKTLQSIKYLLKCDRNRKLTEQFVTFHIFFPNSHIPDYIPQSFEEFWLNTGVSCDEDPPFSHVEDSDVYKRQKGLLYPINLARNIARSAALTHLVFANDIELFSSLNFVDEFLKMIIRNSSLLQGEDPR